MDEFLILLQAKLDEAKSKGNINADINKIQSQINKLKVQAKIDPKTISNLVKQLDGILNQKINISNIGINQSQISKSAQQAGQQIGQQFQQGFNSAIQKGQFKQEFFFSADKQNRVAKAAQKYFSGISNGIVSVQERMQEFEGKSTLSGFVVNIKNAKGEVESLRYSLRNIIDETTGAVTGQMFKYTGGSINDKEAIKQIQAIENAFADYTQKLAQFKSTNTNILSGLTIPLQDFETKLAGLKNGTSTIDEVKNSFKLLGTEASKISANFTGQLSKVDAAIRKLSQGDEIMDGLKASFKGLTNAPKDINTELNKVSKLLKEVRGIESQEGHTSNWSAKYREWSDEVDRLKAKLSVLQKQQASMTTPQIFRTSDLRDAGIPYMTKVSNTIEKQMAAIQKMSNTKGWQNFEIKGIEKANGQIKSLTLTVREADGALKQFEMQRAKLQGNGKAQTGLMQVGDVKILETASQAQERLAQSTEKANAKLAEQQQKIANKIQLLSNGGVKNDYATQIAKLEGNFRSLGLAQDTITAKTQNVKNSLATLRAEFAKPVDQQNFQTIQTANDNLQRELIKSANEFERLRASMKGMATEQQRLNLANTIEAWNQKNTAATREVREQNDRYVVSLRDLNNAMTKVDFNKINTGFKQNENSMRLLNKLGASFTNQMKQAASSFTMWLSASSAVMRVISATRQAMTELKEINTILTEISKTSELTTSQLQELGDNAFEAASKYGKTASDYLTGVQEMSRAGFVGEHAEAMAELSVLAQSAGAITSELANEYLIATNAAYKLNGAVDELNTVLDGQNYITNRNAVSMENLSEATKITASQAASSGVAVDEMTAAIGTMIATTQQGGEVAGRAFKAILMNIQQVSGELDDGDVIDEESLTKYEKACNDLGVSLKTVKDGVVSLREPMEILKELSEAYTSLDQMDARRANLINAIGGKYRGNQLNALLENWSTYEKMLTEYSEGTGSAMEEAMKSANNWEGSLNKLKNSWADTIENIANSDAVITIINGLNGIVTGINKLTDSFGSLGTIGLGAGIFAGFKNVGVAQL